MNLILQRQKQEQKIKFEDSDKEIRTHKRRGFLLRVRNSLDQLMIEDSCLQEEYISPRVDNEPEKEVYSKLDKIFIILTDWC